MRTTSSTPQSNSASVFSSDGVSLMAITGAWERSRIARGRLKALSPWPIRNASTASISESAAVFTHSPKSLGSNPVEGMPSRPNRDA
ncbi:hypothetical protein ABIA24_003212 [Sinorhizobium fredii]